MDEMVINSGDTAWMLASTALVLLMTPGLAFFYGGMVRTKSVLNMMMMSMISIGVVSVLWVIYGFELAFGYEANSPWYGSISFSGLGGVVNDFTNNGGLYPIPVLVFAAFQLMFAIITPALISGAIADRAKFTSWAVFVAIWSTVVYFPVAHWVFAFGNKVGDTVTGTGYLAGKGLQDFAGGTAVHINAGAAIAFAASAEPALNPNHPNQSKPEPSITNGSECGRIDSFRQPTRFPRTIASAKPAAPALI